MQESNADLMKRMQENPDEVDIENVQGQEKVIAMVSLRYSSLSMLCPSRHVATWAAVVQIPGVQLTRQDVNLGVFDVKGAPRGDLGPEIDLPEGEVHGDSEEEEQDNDDDEAQADSATDDESVSSGEVSSDEEED
jgi:hypothetical protein